MLERRQVQLPLVDHEIARWNKITELLARLRPFGVDDHALERAGLLDADLADLAGLAAESIVLLGRVRSRVSRRTVNIGVSGQARNGKSTLLRSLSGLGDDQVPTGKGRPVTAVRSRIFHSTEHHHARLTTHTESSFLDEVLYPYYAEFGVVAAPSSLGEFTALPDVLSDTALADRLAADPRTGPLLARLREIHASAHTWLPFLTGAAVDVPLADLRTWVAYPAEESADPDRRYLAVREAVIHCPFPRTDAVAIGLIDLPGLGELTPRAEERHIAGLHNDVDLVLMVKWPTDTNALWTTADAMAMDLANKARGAAAMRDFAMIQVNTGLCDPANVAALRADLSERVNNRTAEAYFRVLEADVADPEIVREAVLDTVLDHLADALPRMDAAVIGDAMERCARNRDTIVERVRAALQAMRKVVTHTPNETLVILARSLQAELAQSLQGWIAGLEDQASREDVGDSFLSRAQEVRADIRAWIDGGFGDGPEHWQELAVQDFSRKKASRPFAAAALNGVRVELARRLAAVDDVLLARRAEFWASLVAALGRLGVLCADERDPHTALTRLVDVLRELPEPCPATVEAFEFVLDVRLDFRTLVLPDVRDALQLLYPEPPGEDGVHMASLLGVTHDAKGASLLYQRVTQLARQGVHDSGRVMTTIPERAAKVLLAFAEQFEDALIRGREAEHELARVVDAFRDQMWPVEGKADAAVGIGLQRLRGVLAELNATLSDEWEVAA
ncbi:hypothetical protein ACFWNN_09570 [Lentzea sp. NPDC058450]|uniref:hypothetical protein n=1 Tax=Lentzea sp. NPDC058450 TaxID=3346505 RepID=UPI00364A1281